MLVFKTHDGPFSTILLFTLQKTAAPTFSLETRFSGLLAQVCRGAWVHLTFGSLQDYILLIRKQVTLEGQVAFTVFVTVTDLLNTFPLSSNQLLKS